MSLAKDIERYKRFLESYRQENEILKKNIELLRNDLEYIEIVATSTEDARDAIKEILSFLEVDTR